MFDNESTLSISVKDNDSIDDYTQILVCIEKGFFYTEGEKPVKMAGSKKWMYQGKRAHSGACETYGI